MGRQQPTDNRAGCAIEREEERAGRHTLPTRDDACEYASYSTLVLIEDSGDSVNWLRVCLDLPAESGTAELKLLPS